MKKGLVILLLLLSGYGWSQSADPLLPHIKSVVAECTSKVLIVVLSESVKCFSLSADGSEFVVAPLVGSSIQSTSANSCVFSTNIDTVWITLNDPLSPGNYSVTVQNGTDGNTLVDANGKQIPPGESVGFTILPPIPTPLDSLSPVACSPGSLHLVFADPISCNSIAPDGSDFKILGVPSVIISKAEGSCTDGFTRSINITLGSQLIKAGNYELFLVRGSDGNTIVNACGTETPAGAAITFNTRDAVSAAFDFDIAYGCHYDTIALHYLPNGADQWQWYLDSAFLSSSLDTTIIANVFGPRYVQHIASNGICSDTITQIINLDNALKAGFKAPAEVCPKDLVSFNNTSVGNINSWYWDFGDGSSSSLETPAPHQFPESWAGKTFRVSLMVQSTLGCYDTATVSITKMQSCFIAVPNGFTPNGDGKNDFLYPLNAFNVSDLEFRIYNRIGQLVFESREWSHKWDGTINGKPQPTGSYVWTLSYIDGVSGKKFSLNGSSVLIR